MMTAVGRKTNSVVLTWKRHLNI